MHMDTTNTSEQSAIQATPSSTDQFQPSGAIQTQTNSSPSFFNKYKFIFIAIVAVLLLSLGVYLFVASRSQPKSTLQTNNPVSITPSETSALKLPAKRIIYSKETWMKNGVNSAEPKELEYYVYDLEQKKKQLLFKLTPGSGGGFPSVGEISPTGDSIISVEGWTGYNKELGGSGGKEIKQYDISMKNPVTLFTGESNQAIVAANRSVAFSHNGLKIAFTVITAPTSPDGSSAYEIIVFDLKNKGKKVIYKGTVEKQNVKGLVPITWAKDDATLYLGDSSLFEGGGIACCFDEFYTITADGANLKKLPITNRETALSPDEKYITTADGKDPKFACCGFGLFYTSTNLRIYDLINGQFMNVANEPNAVFNIMRWSPDSDAIVYSKTFSTGGETPETYKTSSEYYVFDLKTKSNQKVSSLETQLQDWNRKEYGTTWAFVNDKLVVNGDVVDQKTEDGGITSSISRIIYPHYTLE